LKFKSVLLWRQEPNDFQVGANVQMPALAAAAGGGGEAGDSWCFCLEGFDAGRASRFLQTGTLLRINLISLIFC
jgi:hypothetical protein